MSVIPLNHAPKYVRVHNKTPNLMESTKSSTRNNRRNSIAAAFACATAISDISLTLSCGNDISYSKKSLYKHQKNNFNNRKYTEK